MEAVIVNNGFNYYWASCLTLAKARGLLMGFTTYEFEPSVNFLL